MKKVLMPLVDDFELVEMSGPLDILRRANIKVDTTALSGENLVISSNGIKMFVDKNIKEINFEEYDMILLVGGRGTDNYNLYPILKENVLKFNNNGKYIASICAAPSILAKWGILENKIATVFPSCEEELLKNNVKLSNENIVLSSNILTAKSMNYSIDLGLLITEVLLGEESRLEIEKEIVRL